MAAMAGVAARLLESAAGFDITLLETVVNAFYSATSPEEVRILARSKPAVLCWFWNERDVPSDERCLIS